MTESFKAAQDIRESLKGSKMTSPEKKVEILAASVRLGIQMDTWSNMRKLDEVTSKEEFETILKEIEKCERLYEEEFGLLEIYENNPELGLYTPSSLECRKVGLRQQQ